MDCCPKKVHWTFITLLCLVVSDPTTDARIQADERFQFEMLELDGNIGKVCYAVSLCDVDQDGRLDVVAVTENSVYWYQNPDWRKRVIIQNQTPLDNVCIAPHDIDGDGLPDFALGAGWTTRGTLHWLSRGKSLDEPWQVYSIGEEPWLHRARWADVLGTGRPQLVVSPLNATTGTGVRLTAFEIPADPRRDRWPSTVLSENLNRMHNHWHLDYDQSGTTDTLTASQEGIFLIQQAESGWQAVQLAEGVEAADPAQKGAGEIKLGRLKDGTRFLTSVEPMHGHSVAVYMPSDSERNLKSGPETWKRSVIADGFQRGHGLWTSDLDLDGSEEIIFGHSDTPKTHGVIIFSHTPASDNDSDVSKQWQRHVVDEGGIATEDLMAGDVNGDGRPDIVAGGRATHNLRLYLSK